MSNHDEKVEIKLAECGLVEDEMREGKVGVRYAKGGEEGGGRLVPK